MRTDLIIMCGCKLFSRSKDSFRLSAFFSPQGYVTNWQPHVAGSVLLLLDFGTLGVKMITVKYAGQMQEGRLYEQKCAPFPASRNSPKQKKRKK